MIVTHDLIEARLRVAHQIHLVNRNDNLADTKQTRDVRVTTSLHGDTCACINEQDRKIAGARARRHIARELLVARRVTDDELARGGGEVAIRHINGDPLFAFALEPINEQREVEFAGLGSHRFRVTRCSGKRVFVNHVRVVQESPNERALAIIDRTAGQKSQEFFRFVSREVAFNVARDHLLLCCI